MARRGRQRISRTRLWKNERVRRRAERESKKRLGGIVDRIHLAMEDRGWTAHWLAETALLSPGTVYRLLRGDTKRPQFRTLDYIACALGVPFNWLLEGTQPPRFQHIDQRAVRPKQAA